MEEIIYKNNDITQGIQYNWKKIEKEYNKVLNMVVPDLAIRNTFDWEFPVKDCIWQIEESERGIGKTTKWLIVGLIMHKMYGTKIEYLRNNKQQIVPSNSKELWKTILEYNYIDVIFEGEYNNIKYSYKGWYLCKIEAGEEKAYSDKEVCHMHSLENVDNTKSTYNSPRGDLIIWDECIPVSGYTTENMFIQACQTISTIVRLRLSHHIVCLANTISYNAHIHHELGIVNDVKKIRKGECKYITNENSMVISFRYASLDKKQSEKKKNRLLLTFGFKNPRLSSITGANSWEVKNYPHIPKIEHNTAIINNLRIFIKYYDEILQVKFYHSDVMGSYILIHYVDSIKEENAMIFTNGDIPNTHYIYGLNFSLGAKIFQYYKLHKIYYAHNDEGLTFENFLRDMGYISRLG